MATFTAGQLSHPVVPVVVSPGSLSCSAQIVLAIYADGANIAAASNTVGFTSSGVLQNIAVNLTMPGAGNYYAFALVYVRGIEYAFLNEEMVTVVPASSPAFQITNQAVTLPPSWEGSSWLTAKVTARVTNTGSVTATHTLHLWRNTGGSIDLVLALNSYVWEEIVVLGPGQSGDVQFGPGVGQIVFSPSQSGQLWIQDELGNKGPIWTK